MPAVYAIISFFSYRFFRSYTYYSLIEVAYEAVTLSAFLLLLIEYVASTGSAHSAENAMVRKDKNKLPLPFCYWRYRPTKPYFMYTVKWSVLQYVIIRPLCSIVGVVCEKYNVLCESEGFDFHYANAYLEIVDFISISCVAAPPCAILLMITQGRVVWSPRILRPHQGRASGPATPSQVLVHQAHRHASLVPGLRLQLARRPYYPRHTVLDRSQHRQRPERPCHMHRGTFTSLFHFQSLMMHSADGILLGADALGVHPCRIYPKARRSRRGACHLGLDKLCRLFP